MRPIEFQTDIEFMQALRCVEYRIPKAGLLKRPAYMAALGLRYGLIGIAATYHLFESAQGDDQRRVMSASRSWPRLVEEHARAAIIHRLPFAGDAGLPIAVSRLAESPLLIALPLIFRSVTLEDCLVEVCRQFTFENLHAIRGNWPWYSRRRAMDEFMRSSRESLNFAYHFFERRQYDLEEVPEIALLGE